MNPSTTAIIALKKHGIKTRADLDAYRMNPANIRVTTSGPHKGDRYYDSRYGTLVRLVGKRDADRIIRAAEVASWF